MHFSRRRIIVGLCFGIWIGAAGLICRAFVKRPLDGDEIQLKAAIPAGIVHVESMVQPARVALAQR
jgi:hypothetical protein